jgi:hypothetical protein
MMAGRSELPAVTTAAQFIKELTTYRSPEEEDDYVSC